MATVLELGFERHPALLDRLAALLGLERNDARALMLTLTALHDIGKVLASFQVMEPEAMEQVGHVVHHPPRQRYNRKSMGHDKAGWALFQALRQPQQRRKLADVLPLDCMEAESDAFQALITAFTGHHGQPELGRWDEFRAYAEPEADLAAAAEFVRSMVAHYGWRRGFPTAEAAERASYLVNGVVTLCDWLGSSDEHFGLFSEDMPPEEYVRSHARPAAERLLDEVRPALLTAPGAAGALRFADLFAHLNPGGPVMPSPMQAACERLFEQDEAGQGPLLLVIEDMTGSGKTEGGDYAAHRLVAAARAHGIYAGLPTTTTADQAFARRERLFDQIWTSRLDRVLAHSRRDGNPVFTSTAEREQVETGNADCVDWFARSSRTALLAPAGVGTVDQALLAGLRARYAGLRLVGLWGKVLVVDEVHAYDAYMLAVLEKLLEAHARHGGSAVLLSATLPSGERAKLVAAFRRGLGAGEWPDALDPLAFPALTVVHGGAPPHLADGIAPAPGPGALERVFERVGSVEEASRKVLAHAAAGRSVVWFRNTVDQAREAYEALLAEAAARSLPEPLLWHARFLPGDRRAIEDEVLRLAGKESRPEQRRGRIVVATQVGEQSLDLDFDALVSDLAPIDALIQRAGRSRRHRRDAAGAPKGDGVDERPNLPITVLAPDADPAQARQGWHKALLHGAASVYPDEARLWLGLTHLLDPATIPHRRRAGPIVLDDDLKPLIESVYATDACVETRVPPALVPALLAASGGAMAYRQQGARNRLSFTKGLLADCTEAGCVLSDDEALDAPTRLGESYTLLLAFEEDGRTRLAGEGSPDPIAASEIRVRRKLEQPGSAAVAESLGGALNRSQRVRLGFGTLIVLRWNGETWAGEAGEGKGPPMQLLYCRRRGLMLR